MLQKFRFQLLVQFLTKADRDAAAAALRTQMLNYVNNNPGKVANAELLLDDFFIADANSRETLV